MSSGVGVLAPAAVVRFANSRAKVPAPFSGCGTSVATGTFSFSATSMAGEFLSLPTMIKLARKSVR